MSTDIFVDRLRRITTRITQKPVSTIKIGLFCFNKEWTCNAGNRDLQDVIVTVAGEFDQHICWIHSYTFYVRFYVGTFRNSAEN